MKRVLAAVLLAAAAAAAEPPKDAASALRQQWSAGRGEGSGRREFTHAPMRVEDVEAFLPYGLVAGAHVTPIDHAYFCPKDRGASCDVFACAAGFLVNIQHRTGLAGTSETARDYDDYRVVIEHSGTFYAYYDLITALDPAILAALDPAAVKGFADRKGGPGVSCRIAVKPGQVLGKVRGRTLDFAVVDLEAKLPGFVVPEHYLREPWKIHTADPLEPFAKDVRDAILALNPRKAEPRGGRIDYDVDGTLSGNWFLEGTNGYAGKGDPRGYWMGHLALFPHHIDPSRLVVSFGDWQGKPAAFFAKDGAPAPATVKTSERPTPYELIPMDLDQLGRKREGRPGASSGVALFQLVEDRKLKVETFPGKKASEVSCFTANAKIYER
ncbi:MAG: hypothetical protein HYY18_00420 [Planctomycetes bacterium]|nr:hypothetical protein [Planctomycetota bacterium]